MPPHDRPANGKIWLSCPAAAGPTAWFWRRSFAAARETAADADYICRHVPRHASARYVEDDRCYRARVLAGVYNEADFAETRRRRAHAQGRTAPTTAETATGGVCAALQPSPRGATSCIRDVNAVQELLDVVELTESLSGLQRCRVRNSWRHTGAGARSRYDMTQRCKP